MDDHGMNRSGNDGQYDSIDAARTPQGGRLMDLLSQLELRWGRMLELIGKLRDENAFLQEQLRDREEKSVLLETRHQEANIRAEGLMKERAQLEERMESLLARINQVENTH
ncbi:MAG: cell division protein ZapB [Magnetococcales bacterium]|nr:cell division protein ZapB [Magnetococcales bacterium]MBF0150659.1 cell division protein ZapB [Magnetococcales bacterium]MBF0631648.1 cell division protein ZapB [Magnetococcales bacterium]